MAMGEPAPTDTLALTLDSPRPHCLYEDESGLQCAATELVARGYCAAHYKALQRRGAFKILARPITSTVAVTPETIRRNTRIINRAAKKLIKLAPDFVDILHKGAMVASDKGDTSAAQWALLHTKVVQPVSSGVQGSQNALTVNVGVKVDKDSPA